jgi:hypothetical protein
MSWIDPFGLAPGDPYKTPDAAAIQAEKDINPTSIKEDTEYAGMIYQNPDSSFSYTAPNKGTQAGSNPGSCPSGKKATATYHTHGTEDPGYDNDNFSSQDINYYDTHNQVGYVGVPTGDVKKYTPTPNDAPGQGTVTVIATGVK